MEIMQTFLPYAGFKKTAECLDYKRLGKQRVEAYQILNALSNPQNKWNHHPIVKMWKGYENCLKYYFNTISTEWIERGYKHNMGNYPIEFPMDYPPFIGDEEFHSSHRATLLFKDYEWYSKFGWTEEPKINYKWYGESPICSEFCKEIGCIMKMAGTACLGYNKEAKTNRCKYSAMSFPCWVLEEEHFEDYCKFDKFSIAIIRNKYGIK